MSAQYGINLRNAANTPPENVLDEVAANAAESLRTITAMVGDDFEKHLFTLALQMVYDAGTAINIAWFKSLDGVNFCPIPKRDFSTGALTPMVDTSTETSIVVKMPCVGAKAIRAVMSIPSGGASDLITAQATLVRL